MISFLQFVELSEEKDLSWIKNWPSFSAFFTFVKCEKCEKKSFLIFCDFLLILLLNNKKYKSVKFLAECLLEI
jgi:hypothetical protein